MSEWLRRWTRNPLGSARRGSNPLGVVFFLFEQSLPIFFFMRNSPFNVGRLVLQNKISHARLAQSVERQPFKLVVVGSSPTVGDIFYVLF